MNYKIVAISAIITFLLLNPDLVMSDELTSKCVAQKEIAYDSVINSRVGLPVESSVSYLVDMPDGHVYMTIVFNAYSWKGTAYAYSGKIFAQCYGAQNDNS